MSQLKSQNPAVTIHSFGDTDVLQFHSDYPRPTCKDGEVLIENYYAGINPIDCKTRAGLGWAAEKLKGHLPAILGFDFAGIVIESKDTRFSTGQRVCALDFTGGAYARYASINADLLTHVPDSISLAEAGALPCAGTTALQLIEQLNLSANNHVVLSAPAGGVGHIALQLLARTKAKISIICSAEKYALINGSVPITEWIDYHETSTYPSLGADILLDLVGGDAGIAALATLRSHGSAICLPSIHVPTLKKAGLARNIAVEGFLVKPQARILVNLLDELAQRQLQIHVAHQYPLREVALAHSMQEHGRTYGKIILETTSRA